MLECSKKFTPRGQMLVAMFSALVGLGGCTSLVDPEADGRISAILGAVAGAVAGAVHCLNNDKKECVQDVIVGATVGYVVGEAAHAIRKAYAKRDKSIEEISDETGVAVETQTHVVLDETEEAEYSDAVADLSEAELVAANKAQAAYKAVVRQAFATNSSTVLPSAEQALRKIADEYRTDGMREILIVGHSDSAGEAAANQTLSEARARAVANLFVEQGFPREQVFYQGAGESEPLADNSTTVGRANNRRVEVIDAATTEYLGRAKRLYIANSLYVQKAAAKSVIVEAPAIASAAVPEVESAESTESTASTAAIKPTVYGSGSSVIDFAGRPYDGELAMPWFTATATPRAASSLVFASAHAAPTQGTRGTQGVPAFLEDDLPVAGAVKRAGGGEVALYDFDDYLPGYKNAVVYTTIETNQTTAPYNFAIHPLSLLQERSVATSTVGAKVYRQNSQQDNEWQTQVVLDGVAVSYPAVDNDEVALYRWQASDGAVKQSGILGVDLFVRRFKRADFGRVHVLPGQVYYLERGEVYVAETDFSIKLPTEINPKWRFFL